MDALTALHFLRPQWFLLLLPYTLILLLERRRNDQARHWRPVIAGHLLREMVVRGGDRRWLSPPVAARVIAVLLVVAIAGPSWQRGESPFAEDAAALVIALDLSASMAGSDVQPTRLQRARDKLLTLQRARGDAYTGLVAYAGSAHVVLPLSDDSTVLRHYLAALEVGMLPREGKAPELVVPLARELLAARERGGTLLLVTDGAGNAAAASFASMADDAGLQLAVWGIGTVQAELEREAQDGAAVRAQPLQEAQLEAIANAAGGHYQRITHDDTDLRTLLQHIEQHFVAGEDSARPWIDAGYYLLFPIAALYLLFFWRGWALRW